MAREINAVRTGCEQDSDGTYTHHFEMLNDKGQPLGGIAGKWISVSGLSHNAFNPLQRVTFTIDD